MVTTQRATLTPCQEPRGVPASRGTNWSLCCDVGFFGRSFQRKLRLRGIFFQVGRAYTHTLSAYYEYLEPKWPVVLVGKGLVLWGWPSKIEVSWVLFPSQFGPPRPTLEPNWPLVLIGKDPCVWRVEKPTKIEDIHGFLVFLPPKSFTAGNMKMDVFFFGLSRRQPGNDWKVKHVKLQGRLRKFHKRPQKTTYFPAASQS